MVCTGIPVLEPTAFRSRGHCQTHAFWACPPLRPPAAGVVESYAVDGTPADSVMLALCSPVFQVGVGGGGLGVGGGEGWGLTLNQSRVSKQSRCNEKLQLHEGWGLQGQNIGNRIPGEWGVGRGGRPRVGVCLGLGRGR